MFFFLQKYRNLISLCDLNCDDFDFFFFTVSGTTFNTEVTQQLHILYRKKKTRTNTLTILVQYVSSSFLIRIA